MRLTVDQLDKHLEGRLAPIYVLAGDEPLQIQEARDSICAAAKRRGFSDRVLLNVELGFDWSTLGQFAQSLSLFGDKRLIDLRLPTAKPGDAGARAVKEYAANPPEDNLLLVSLGKLEKGTATSQWYKALERSGATLRTWPVDARSLPGWIRRRAAKRGLTLSPEAAEALAERVEGNLLACAQEIDKLHMLHGEGRLDTETVLTSVADSARYSVFDLVDAALAGDGQRSVRIVRGLREEGVAPPFVAWALTREIRALAAMAGDVADGMSVDETLRKHRVWDKRRGVVGAALRRHGATVWLDLLQWAARADRAAKGGAGGQPWDELEGLGLAMGGLMLPRRNPYNR